MKNEFIQILLGLAIVLIGTAGAYAITTIASFYKSKRDQILEDIESTKFFKNNDIAKSALTFINSIISNVVTELDDTVKKDLLKATEDGKLTDEEKAMLKNKAIELVKSQISDPIKEAVSILVGDIDSYIGTVIENQVTDLKNDKDELSIWDFPEE